MTRVCPDIETAIVKRALSRTSGSIVPPLRARGIIAESASRAVERVRAGKIAAPEIAPPFEMEVVLAKPMSDDTRAAFAQRFPEFTVVDDRTVAFADGDMHLAYRKAVIVQFIAETPAAVRSY
jgi:D-aminopeptidase